MNNIEVKNGPIFKDRFGFYSFKIVTIIHECLILKYICEAVEMVSLDFAGRFH